MKRVVLSATLVAACGAAPGADTGAPEYLRENGSAEVVYAIKHDVSPPFRELMRLPDVSARGEKGDHEAQPARAVPAGHAVHDDTLDGALQGSPGAYVATTAGVGFAGVGNGDYGFAPDAAPPDTNLAVGATQVVQWVNEKFAVFSKSGSLIAGPTAGSALWTGFGGGCETNNDGDPIAQYDKLADRWVLTQFSVSTTPYMQCVAVSTTSDATGTYNRYAFSYGNGFNDYPKVGVWPDGYYVTYNIFNNGSTFAGAKLCAFDRASMLAGAPATQQCFQLSTSYGGVLPADLDGANSPPPAGAPEVFANFGSNSLNLWKMHVDWAASGASTLTGPINLPVAAFSAACRGGGTCIPQAGTRNQLDSLADRLMYRLAYRNMGSYDSLVVNHSVNAGSGKKSSSVGVRWYEIRNPTATPSVFQQGTFAPDATYRWMGSIAMDKAGDIAMGYSASSSTLAPSIRYTGRTVTDALGTMATENSVKVGGGSQTGSLHRWGDYSTIAIDPVDDCTFWYTTEYLKASGSFNWSTWITSFKFPNCQ